MLYVICENWHKIVNSPCCKLQPDIHHGERATKATGCSPSDMCPGERKPDAGHGIGAPFPATANAALAALCSSKPHARTELRPRSLENAKEIKKDHRKKKNKPSCFGNPIKVMTWRTIREWNNILSCRWTFFLWHNESWALRSDHIQTASNHG